MSKIMPLWLLTLISFDFAEEYFTYHFQIHVFLQRIGVLSPWKLPNPLFFIPFTSSSLILAPAPPVDFSAGSLLQWFAAAIINTSPFLAYALWRRTWSWLRMQLIAELYHRFPIPDGFPEYRVRASPPTDLILEQPLPPANMQQPDISPAEIAIDADSSTARPREADPNAPQLSGERGMHASMQSLQAQAQDVTGSSRPGQGPTTIRRRSSTFSGRGDEFGSDEEETEAISGPLISFDVETTDAADAPPGIWFTELRPTVSSDTRSQTSQQPVPLNTALTRQPIQHASRVLGTLGASQLLAPVEAFVLQYLTRSFLAHRGLPTDHLFRAGLTLSNGSLRPITNYLFVDSLSLALQTLLWITNVRRGWSLHLSPEQWTQMPAEQQAEWA
jgi:hypothetical protein